MKLSYSVWGSMAVKAAEISVWICTTSWWRRVEVSKYSWRISFLLDRKKRRKKTPNEHEVEQHNKTKYTNQIFYFYYYLILIISSNINLTSSSSSTGSTDTDCTRHHSRSHYSLFSPLTLVSTLSFSSFVHCPSPWIFDPVSLTSLTFTTHLYSLQVYSPPHT